MDDRLVLVHRVETQLSEKQFEERKFGDILVGIDCLKVMDIFSTCPWWPEHRLFVNLSRSKEIEGWLFHLGHYIYHGDLEVKLFHLRSNFCDCEL